MKPLHLFLRSIAFLSLFAVNPAPADSENCVVVYTSVDEVVSSEVFRRIEDKTGLEILPVYDTESTKTTGLYLRLLQEAKRPRADAFWNSEFSRTILLKQKGLLEGYRSHVAQSIPEQFHDPEGTWTGFTARARVIVRNTDLVDPSEIPRSATEMASPRWRSKITWANPMFGTTATHLGALLSLKGKDGFRRLLEGWTAQFQQVAGNSQAAELVAKGAFPLGLTDTDDYWRLKLRGYPIDATVLDPEGNGCAFLIPNTVSILRGAPHPKAARRFVDALLAPEIEEFLAFSTSRQIPVRASVKTPEDLEPWLKIPVLKVRYEEVADSIDPAIRMARELAGR